MSDLISRADAMALCEETYQRCVDMAINGEPSNARQRESMANTAERLAYRIRAMAGPSLRPLSEYARDGSRVLVMTLSGWVIASAKSGTADRNGHPTGWAFPSGAVGWLPLPAIPEEQSS